jgi:hypothetical protein
MINSNLRIPMVTDGWLDGASDDGASTERAQSSSANSGRPEQAGDSKTISPMSPGWEVGGIDKRPGDYQFKP